MVALDLIVGVLAVQYIVYVMVQSDILVPVRRAAWLVPIAGQRFFGPVLSCFNCASFWAGLFVLLLWWVGGWAWQFAYVCALATGGQGLFAVIDRLAERKAP